jgi:hypothetical protein
MKGKILLVSGMGAVAGLVYALETSRRKRLDRQAASATESSNGEGSSPRKKASMAKLGESPQSEPEPAPRIDDRGTDQSEASEILKHIRDGAFEASDEKLALALGRPTEEIEEWTRGGQHIDGDVVMKARALALERGLRIE